MVLLRRKSPSGQMSVIQIMYLTGSVCCIREPMETGELSSTLLVHSVLWTSQWELTSCLAVVSCMYSNTFLNFGKHTAVLATWFLLVSSLAYSLTPKTETMMVQNSPYLCPCYISHLENCAYTCLGLHCTVARSSSSPCCCCLSS
jgi:hypothetical protein